MAGPLLAGKELLQVKIPDVTSEQGPEARRDARILVVEDSIVNQQVAIGMLAALGYRADVVANGLEAIEAVGRIPYAAILMDCQMPEMDGYEATREIRLREGSGRHTPIIALTADVMKDARAKSLSAGMDDYITKPLKRAELAAALERSLPRLVMVESPSLRRSCNPMTWSIALRWTDCARCRAPGRPACSKRCWTVSLRTPRINWLICGRQHE